MNRKLISLAVVGLMLASCGGGGNSSTVASTPGNTRSVATTTNNTDPGTLPSLPPNIAEVDGGGSKRLLMIYMVGTDLESNSNTGGAYAAAGTTDLNELKSAFDNLTDEQLSQFDLIVAFGGAKRPGWGGMKIADQQILEADSNTTQPDPLGDNVYGTLPDSQYLYSAPQANMGDQSSFKAFLELSTARYINYKEVALIMWDHGNGFNEFGNDENFGGDGLTMDEIASSLAQTNPAQIANTDKLHLLGFDACLNANFEVARKLAPYSDLMVASEELEPGHGWDYRYVGSQFGGAQSIESFAIGLADDYTTNPTHSPDTKTLSVLRLQSVESVANSLETLSAEILSSLTSAQSGSSLLRSALIKSLESAENFGESGATRRGSAEFIDLVNFLDKLSTEFSASGISEFDSLISELRNRVTNELVLASRKDASRQNANGVSIASLTTNNYSETIEASPSFRQLVSFFVEAITNDVTDPLVNNPRVSSVSDGNGGTVDVLSASFSDDNLSEVYSVSGYTIADPDSNTTFLFVDQISQADLDPSSNEFFTNGWDGTGLFLLDDGQSTYIPTLLSGLYTRDGRNFAELETEIEIYLGQNVATVEPGTPDAEILPAKLKITVDVTDPQNPTVTSAKSRFIELDAQGNVLFIDRNTLDFQPGINVAFFRFVADLSTGEVSTEPTTERFVTVKNTTSLQFGVSSTTDENGNVLPIQTSLVGFDLSGNVGFTQPQRLNN